MVTDDQFLAALKRQASRAGVSADVVERAIFSAVKKSKVPEKRFLLPDSVITLPRKKFDVARRSTRRAAR
jgi:hypothetical protein